MTDDRVLKTYVWHGEQCYFVSTIIRDSSAFVSPPPRYAETIAWEFDWSKNVRGNLLAMDGDGEAFTQHMRMCERIYKTGKAENTEDEGR